MYRVSSPAILVVVVVVVVARAQRNCGGPWLEMHPSGDVAALAMSPGSCRQ